MFPGNCNNEMAPNSVSEIIGINGIPKPKSLLSSFLFGGFPSSETEQEQRPRSFDRPTNLSLQSNLLPPSLLKDNARDNAGPQRTRTITDDSEEPSYRGNLLLPRPRRSWNISNDDRTSLPKVPDYYPPFDPNCTAIVTDAPPSVVVVRISECLRKRSIAAEYDDEAVTARCMTVDRCHFSIQLYRTSSSQQDDVIMGDPGTLGRPNDAVIVEVQKLTNGSSSMSFHAACIKILMAAKGLDNGEDNRPARCRNGVEFRPMLKRSRPSLIGSGKRQKSNGPDEQSFSSNSSSSSRYYDSMDSFDHKSSSTAEPALEAALALLKKDRLECKRLGMERLVNLTNWEIVGKETSRYVSRRLLLQEREVSGTTKESQKGKWRLMNALMHPEAEQVPVIDQVSPSQRRSESRNQNDKMVRSFLESSAVATISPKKQSHERSSSFSRGASFLKKKTSILHRRSASTDSPSSQPLVDLDILSTDEMKHEAQMRSLALRVLCNSLHNLAKSNELQHILYPTNARKQCEPSRWVQAPFLLSLVQDLQGAGRPPSVSEHGYMLASVHEAAMAARCLRLLAGYSDDDHHRLHPEDDEDPCEDEIEDVRDLLRSEPVLERLSYARSCGRATHAILQFEAEQTYHRLTEDVRSC